MADILFAQIAGENLRTGTDIIQTSGRNAIGIAPARYVSDALATSASFAAHPRFVARSSNGRYWRALPEAGRIAVEVGGAKGDGTTDDGPAIRATFAYAAAIGARGASFGSASYRAEFIPPSEVSGLGNPPIQLIASIGSIADYDGAQLTRQGSGRGLTYHPELQGTVVNLPLAADVTSGSREVTLQPGGGASLVPGDTVQWQLGEFPYDPPECPNWDFARVEAVTGDVVRLDKPIPDGLVLANVTGPNKRLRKLAVLRDHVISGLTLGGGTIEEGISLYCAQRVTLSRVGGRNIGAGTVVAQYCDGLTLEDCWQDGSPLTQPSFGAAFSFAETRNCLLLRPRARRTLSLVKAEAGAEVAVVGGMFENTLVDAQGQPMGGAVVVINASGRASVTVHDLTVTGFGGYRLVETSNGVAGYNGLVQLTGTTRLRHSSAPYSIALDAIAGMLDLTVAGLREVYDFTRLRRWKRRFVLRDGEYFYGFGPAGLLVRARAYTTPGVTVGDGQQLTGLWLGRVGDNGANIARGPSGELEPGKDVAVRCYGGLVAGGQWTLRNQQLALLCVTAPNAGLDAANEFVEFEGWFAEQADLDVTISEAAFRAGDGDRDPFEAVFPDYDLPALAAGASTALDLAIADMTASDFIASVRIAEGFAPLELRGAEARDGAVRLILGNPTGGAVDRAPADLAVAFFRPSVGA